MKKPWGGRFEKDTEQAVEQFAESVSFDCRLYKEDIRGSVAHAEMLAECELLTKAELVLIREGLRDIEREIEDGQFEWSVPLEDVHMNIEAALIARIGDVGRKLHTARSRNDQVACDVRLWCRGAIERTGMLVQECQRALVGKAQDYRDAIMPGCTHMQHAQPVLLAHELLAFVEMLERDRQRLAGCRERTNVSPLGACALAGTALPIEAKLTAEKLGFDAVFSNSIDAVSDRDFVIELVSALAIAAMHLSRLAEQWLIWSTREHDFIDLDEAYCTGSSIMPQKKNPDVLELIRGRCGRVYGDLMALLTHMKGLPLAYNRDMQEDKEALFDAVDTVCASLSIAASLIRTTEFKRENMRAAAEQGHMDATALADYLVKRGIPFREAHQIVGRAVRRAAADGVELRELSLEELGSFSPVIADDVYGALGTQNCVENYRSHGSSSPAEVDRQLESWQQRLGQ